MNRKRYVNDKDFVFRKNTFDVFIDGRRCFFVSNFFVSILFVLYNQLRMPSKSMRYEKNPGGFESLPKFFEKNFFERIKWVETRITGR